MSDMDKQEIVSLIAGVGLFLVILFWATFFLLAYIYRDKDVYPTDSQSDDQKNGNCYDRNYYI
mgnify:CR=1 FL=1